MVLRNGVGDEDAEEHDLEGVFKWLNEGRHVSKSVGLRTNAASPVWVGGEGSGRIEASRSKGWHSFGS